MAELTKKRANANEVRRLVATLPAGAHKLAGRYDKAGRWYPDDSYAVIGTFQVRSPSRNFPYSYLKHFYTRVYARRLFAANPRLYMLAAGIDPTSPDGKQLVALAAMMKMGAMGLEG